MSSTTAAKLFHLRSPELKLVPPRSFFRRHRIAIFIALAVILAVLIVLYIKVWPFSKDAVVEDLVEASGSAVTIHGYHPTYFPPGCILDGVEFRHGPEQAVLISIQKLIVQGSYLGILRSHVPRLTVIGGHVFIPKFGSGSAFQSQHSSTVVDEIVANGTIVEFASKNPHQQPLRFDVHDATLQDVRWGSPIQYRLKFHNPNPPGEIAIAGHFGAWTTGHPENTPISGEYTFDHADLSIYGGISGFLSSRGKFDGLLQHVNISGTTDTPDFSVQSSGNTVKVKADFDAYVDAIHGDTFLKRVGAHFGRTAVIAEGSIAGTHGRKGKSADLQLTVHQGRIEDILGLFVTGRSPMSGPVSLRTHAELPPGDRPFLKKVRLKGNFGIANGNFIKPETQGDVNALSAGARGQDKENPETVMTDLLGQVTLVEGLSNFSDLSFYVPGAHARVHGTYDILNHKIDLHGKMRVDTKISKTSSGMKSFLLKLMDPIFKKKKKGEVVPVHITGTYEKPAFGLDLGNQQEKRPVR